MVRVAFLPSFELWGIEELPILLSGKIWEMSKVVSSNKVKSCLIWIENFNDLRKIMINLDKNSDLFGQNMR